MFYGINEHGRELHQKWDFYRQELISGRLKEQHLFNSFLDHLPSGNPKPESFSKVQLGRHASIRDELIEYQMERLAKHLAEYSAAKMYRKKIQGDFQKIIELRTEAQPFALRGQTFVRAESLFKSVQPFLSYSVAQSIGCYKECYGQAVDALNEFEFEHEDNHLSKDAIVKITQDVTFLYLRKRLNALPAYLRGIFELLVAICIADSEDMAYLAIFRRLLSENVVRNIAKRVNTVCHEINDNDGVVDSLRGFVKKMASEIVLRSIHAALTRVTAHSISADGISSPQKLDPVLHTDLLTAFELIQKTFTEQISNETMQKKFSRHLKDDMIQHATAWRQYLLVHAGNQAHISSPAQIHLKPNSPPWIENQLNPLEKLMVYMCLFEFVPRDILDQFTTAYLGTDVVERLRVYDDSAQYLSTTARNTTFSTPLLVITDPTTHVAVPFQSIVQCARAGAVRDEITADLSMGDSLGEPLLVSQLKTIERLAMSGGWIVIRDMELANQKTGTVLRHQVESIQNMQSIKKCEFRLWLLYEHSGLNNFSTAANLLALLHTERFVFEYPSTLPQLVNFFRTKSEQHFIRARGQSGVATSRRLGSFAEPSTSASIYLEKIHSWILNALVVFHSVFRRHLQRIQAQTETQDPAFSGQSLSPDMMISYFEIERASGLLQMHMEQRIMAIKASSSSSSVMNVAAVIASESQTLVNLASLVYMNRQWHSLHLSQCRELLAWCFQTQANVNDQPSDLAGNKEILAKRRNRAGRLRDEMNSSASTMYNRDDIESQFLPPSRQYQLDTFESWHVISFLQNIYGARTQHCSYSAAQQALKVLAEQLPSVSSLSAHVHIQRKERHASIIESWKKPKGGICVLVGPKQDKHSSWKQALLTHLVQTEIPALETYLTEIWNSMEMVLSLNAGSLESILANQSSTSSTFHREVVDILESISKQDVPKSWAACKSAAKQQHQQRCQGYLFSRQLTRWLTWIRRAIGFYQGLHSSATPTPHLPEAIYLPALHHPEGANCLQSV